MLYLQLFLFYPNYHLVRLLQLHCHPIFHYLSYHHLDYLKQVIFVYCPKDC
nr:MAG TPA: hypothetical protein [Caudoviricetes sp.]